MEISWRRLGAKLYLYKIFIFLVSLRNRFKFLTGDVSDNLNLSQQEAFEQIDARMKKIEKAFDISEVCGTKVSKDAIRSYYKQNGKVYRKVHSSEGFLHCGISYDGKYKSEDLQEQARLVEKLFLPETKTVLELATGQGANLHYLARRHPSINFAGLDITSAQLMWAKSHSKELPNFRVEEGDFHDLSRYDSSQFDVVFIIEALCYSGDKKRVLEQVFRILKPGGAFIIIDVYFTKKLKSASEKIKRVAQSYSRSMAIESLAIYDEFRSEIEKSDFQILDERSMVEYVKPSVQATEWWADFFLSIPLLRSVWTKVYPLISNNVIPIYLMLPLINARIIDYCVTTLKKMPLNEQR